MSVSWQHIPEVFVTPERSVFSRVTSKTQITDVRFPHLGFLKLFAILSSLLRVPGHSIVPGFDREPRRGQAPPSSQSRCVRTSGAAGCVRPERPCLPEKGELVNELAFSGIHTWGGAEIKESC